MKRMDNGILLKSSLKEYSLDDIRYAAYSVTDDAFVLLKKTNAKTIEIILKQKRGAGIKKTAKRFLEELKCEKIRSAIFKNNAELREFLILKALSSQKAPEPQNDDAGLTPEQEKELDDLIRQVEKEIKKESSGRKKDPLEINRTWEEKYGDKNKKIKR